MPLFQHVAATGVVAADGKVQPVDFLREKLEGIVREAPFVPLVLVPDLNLADVPGGLPLQVVPVKSVSEALDLFWGGTDLGRIQARHSPVTAGEEAFRLERRQRHAQADVLAGHVLSELAGKELESRKTRVAAVQALAVRGINFTHRGDTANALADFARIDDLVRREGLAEVPGILPIDLRTLVLAARTSTMLDALDCRDAIAACDELRGRLHDVSADVALPFLGSLLRCQTAAGLLDEAELTWSTYHDLVDEPEDKPRMWCYRIELLVKKAVRGDAGALRKASDALKEGLDANRGVLCNHERRQNDRFLKLAECRICAVAGDARGATALAGPLPLHHASAWPEYHLHRLAGEALARAGRIEEALERLEAARRNVAPEADTFLKLVLLTAGAREALLRLERDRKGWEEPARQFADVYECYKPGQIRWPAARGGRTRWADRLRRALESIPY
jgi:tetratricopeptide (TPR) repeat protein